MASVTTENIGSLHEKLTVTVSKEDYLPSFEKSLKNYSKNANIQGFRKGAVPQGLVRKMYGKSIFVQEVINVANKQLEEHLKSNKTNIFAQPLALPLEQSDFDYNNPVDYNFDFEIGIKPEFEVTPLNNKGSITKYKIIADDKMIDEEVANIRRKAGKLEDIEKAEEPSDVLYITYEAINGESQDDVVENKSLPAKLAELLKDKAAGFTAEFTPKADLTEKELADFAKHSLKTDVNDIADNAQYKLTLTKVARLQESDLNQELYDQTFPGKEIKDEAGFRAVLKAEIEKELDRVSFERMQNDMFETLVHETPLELPAIFLKNWLKQSGEKLKTDEEVEREFSSFDHQLRWQLISEKLISDNKIDVSFDEIMHDVKTKVMSYFGMGADSEEEPEWIKGYLDKMAKDDKTMDETYRRLLFDKLFNKLQEVWQVQEKEISLDEFSKIAPAHHHHH